MVEKAEEGEGVRFALEDGRKFKSASSAASALMGGKAVNGWRFWSVQGAEPKAKEGREKPETQAAKSKRLVYRVPNQKGRRPTAAQPVKHLAQGDIQRVFVGSARHDGIVIAGIALSFHWPMARTRAVLALPTNCSIAELAASGKD